MTRNGSRDKHELSPRRQRFVDEFLAGVNATQAAIRAGYSKRTAKQIGARLLTFVDVREAVKRGQEKAREQCEVTRDSMARQFDEDRLFARKANQAGAAVSASTAKAKMYGLFSEPEPAPPAEDPEVKRVKEY